MADKVYLVSYRRQVIRGDLGAFWATELSLPTDGSSVHVGPVSATSPELPIDAQLDFGAQGFTRVAATTASGHAYAFAATRMPILDPEAERH